MSFTPAPWTVTRCWSQTCGDNYIINEEKRLEAEQEGNAHLIAAAPELLGACKSFMGWLDEGFLVRNVEGDEAPDWAPRMMAFVSALSQIQLVISKAEGKR